jgi:hypothetical protein
MATIREALAASDNLKGYEPIEEPMRGIGLPPQTEGQPTINPFLRCPMPPVGVTPDSLRQYYVRGQVPQFRILTPASSVGGSGGGGTTVINASSTVTAAAGITPSAPTVSAVSVSLTTPTLNNNGVFASSIPISKSFQLLKVSANGSCRVQIYGTAVAQSNDSFRGLDVAPLPGTQQDLITDVVLDTSPFQWSWQNRVGSNADSPQNSIIYMTITNIDVSSTVLTVTLLYVPLESV